MKHAKSKGGAGAGVSGISQNHAAYQRWVKTTHERSQYLSATFALADMKGEGSETTFHKDVRPTEVKRSEGWVLSTIESVKSFLNPFGITDKDNLYNISAGCKMSPEIETDVLNAEHKGEDQKEVFIEERLKTNENFFQPIKRLKLKTMEDNSRKTNFNKK